MARIRLGDFGNAVAPLAPASRVPVQAFVRGDGGLFDTAQRIGAEGVAAERHARDVQIEREADIAAQARREEELETRRRMAELRSAQRMQAYTGFNLDIDEFTDSLTDQLTSKSIKREQLPELFSKGLEDLKKKRLEGLDPESQALVTGHFQVAERGARRKIGRAFDADVKQERVAVINDTGEQLQRMAVKDPEGAIRQWNALLDAHGPGVFGADKVGGMKQSFAERAHAQHFTARIVGARNNYRGLQQIEADIAKNEVLDPDKKSILLGRTGGMIETLAARAERAQQSRLRTVEREINALTTMTLQGFDPTPERILAVQQAAKGTELEPMAANMAATATASARFRSMPPRGQEAMLNDAEAAVRRNPTPEGIELVAKFRTIARNQQQLVRDDPISFAAQKGIADVVPIDFSKPDTLKDQLLSRVNVARGVQAQYGGELKVLTKQESILLSDFLRKGTPEDKHQILTMLRTGVGDDRAYRATLNQIAPDNPVVAVAGTRSREVALSMLRGQAALHPDRKTDGPGGQKPVPMPKDEELRRAFNGYERDAYAGNELVRSAVYQGALAIYAEKSVNAGDFSGNFNSSRFKDAVKAATGGIERWNGSAIVMPEGWTKGKFTDEMDTRVRLLDASGTLDKSVTRSKLWDLPLVNVGDGKYAFRSGGDKLVHDSAGKLVVIDMTKPAAMLRNPDGTVSPGMGELGSP